MVFLVSYLLLKNIYSWLYQVKSLLSLSNYFLTFQIVIFLGLINSITFLFLLTISNRYDSTVRSINGRCFGISSDRITKTLRTFESTNIFTALINNSGSILVKTLRSMALDQIQRNSSYLSILSFLHLRCFWGFTFRFFLLGFFYITSHIISHLLLVLLLLCWCHRQGPVTTIMILTGQQFNHSFSLL